MGRQRFKQMLQEVHNFLTDKPNTLCHVGQRKTMEALSQEFYTFGMRQQINKYISMCAPCRLNNHPPTRPKTSGNQLRTEENGTLGVNCMGPIGGFGTTTSGQPQYVIVMINSFSRYLSTYVSRTTGDADIFRALNHLRINLNGLPTQVQVDNALLSKNSKSKAFLQQYGVRIQREPMPGRSQKSYRDIG